MGLIPEITCHRCGYSYSGLKKRCPQCGAPRPSQSTRTAPTTAAATSGTASFARAEVNGRWQLIFGAILAAAVLLATIVLIAGRNSASASSPGSATTSSSSGQSSVTLSDTYLPSPSPSPVPTPETDVNAITGMEIVFGDRAVQDITLTEVGSTVIQLEARWYPATANVTVEWSSSNENILTVDSTGLVTLTGANPEAVVNATVTAKCGGLEASCIIYVPYYQAPYIQNNTFTAGNNNG